MRSVTELKSLGDLRTGISAHVRSAPRRKGTTFLEAYLLDTERQRLESELAALHRRQARLQARLGELRVGVEQLVGEVEGDQRRMATPLSMAAEDGEAESSEADPPKWRSMAIDY